MSSEFRINNNLKKIQKKLQKKINLFIKDNDTVIVRALNKTADKAKIEISRLISKELGITVRSVKKAIKISKATRFNMNVSFFISGARLPLIKPAATTRSRKKKKFNTGIIYTGVKGKRIRVDKHIKGGSKPFVIDAKAGGVSGGENVGKKVAVFRRPEDRRKVTTLKFYSIPHYTRIKYEEQFKEFMFNNLKKEYKNQLKRLQYIKQRR